MPNRIELVGTLSRFIWHRDGNPWAVSLFDDEHGVEHKVVGDVADCDIGKTYRIEGFEESNNYGTSIKAVSVIAAEPRGKDSVISYLQTLPGIGRVSATQMVTKIGADDILRALREDNLELFKEKTQVRLSIKQLETVRSAIAEENNALEADLQVRKLLGAIATDGLVKKILEKWGDKASAKIQVNPWCLANLPRVGFLKADSVAQHIGVDPVSPDRIKAGIRHIIGEIRNSGHTRLSCGTIRERTAELLDYGQSPDMVELVSEQLPALVADGVLVELDEDWYQLTEDHRCELEIADRLSNRVGRLSVKSLWDPNPEGHKEMAYANLFGDQQQALKSMVQEGEGGVCILTGAPGTGKTTMVRAFFPYFDQRSIALCAPTGKAARRLTEQSGLTASTIHMLLEPVPFGERSDKPEEKKKEGDVSFSFNRCEDNPIDKDLVVIDEASMVDIYLFRALLRAIPDETYLLIVGDPNQLPSVGVGAVLRDLIESDCLPHASLTEIKRTNPGPLLQAIHRVKDGRWENQKNSKDSDLFTIVTGSEAETVEQMATLYLDRLPKLIKSDDSIMDIQLLVPWKTKKGLSAKSVNEEVQRLRAIRGEVELGGKFDIGIGDKVIQTRNNYDLGIVNGDMGTVLDLEKIDSTWQFQVQFIGYKDAHWVPAIGNDLDLAYAVTVHKSQGSEWPVVVLPAMGTTSPFYDRTLFYTGLSRAQSYGVIVGRQEGLTRVVERQSVDLRRTYLKKALEESCR